MTHRRLMVHPCRQRDHDTARCLARSTSDQRFHTLLDDMIVASGRFGTHAHALIGGSIRGRTVS